MGFGSFLGSALGDLGSHLLPIPGVNGRDLGGFLGGLTGLKKGGRVRKAKVKAVPRVYQRKKAHKKHHHKK